MKLIYTGSQKKILENYNTRNVKIKKNQNNKPTF